MKRRRELLLKTRCACKNLIIFSPTARTSVVVVDDGIGRNHAVEDVCILKFYEH